jgi:hypothetical protein
MSGLTSQQLEAVGLLAKGKTHAETAAALGIVTKTIQRWSKREDFKQAIADVHQQATDKTVERTACDIAEELETLLPEAFNVLRAYLTDTKAKGSDRLRAVHIIGNWAGLNQSQPKQEQTRPEENLKDYLQFLSSKNGNGSTANHN